MSARIVEVNWTTDQKECVEILTESRVMSQLVIRPPHTSAAVMFVHRERYCLGLLNGGRAGLEIVSVPVEGVPPAAASDFFSTLLTGMSKPGTTPSGRGEFEIPGIDVN